MIQAEETARLVLWARYLYWADLHHRAFEELLDTQKSVETSEQRARFFALMSQWYASLWVVVEAWQATGTADAFIDGLLSHQPVYCELLRRYRNGVFHFQPDFLDARFLALLREGAGPVEWTHALHSEFLRFLWEWPDRRAPDTTTAQELRAKLREIVGWLPEDTLVAKISRLEAQASTADEMLASCGEPTSAQARELRAAASSARKVAREARRKYFAERQTYVTRRWLPSMPE